MSFLNREVRKAEKTHAADLARASKKCACGTAVYGSCYGPCYGIQSKGGYVKAKSALDNRR